ncbi:MAG: AI-2E family transporter [Myxococcaceae bacterium]
MTENVRIHVSARSVWIVGLNLLAITGVVWAGWQTWGVLSWMLISLFLAAALHPLCRWLTRHGMRYGLAVATVMLSLLALVVILVTSFVPMFIEQGRALAHNAPGFVDQLKHHKWVAWADARFGVVNQIQSQVKSHAAAAAVPILGLVTQIVKLLAESFTILTLTMFVLLFGEDLFQSGLRWLPPPRRPRASNLAHRMADSVGGYIAGTFFISATGAIVNGIALAVLGVPYFMPLALAMLVLCIIPWIGSFIGAVLIFMTATASNGLKTGLIALGIMLLWQQVEHRITPLVQAKTVKMNALLLAVVALFGTALAGLLGAVLAVPVAGALQVVVSDILLRRERKWLVAKKSPGDERQMDLPIFDEDEQPPVWH